MCDWGGGPYGNGAYDPHGITKHSEPKPEPERTTFVFMPEDVEVIVANGKIIGYKVKMNTVHKAAA